MRTVLLHLERLRRHYDAAVRTYDHVSLLDLSHSLRVWADLKAVLPNIAPAFATTLAFKTAIPAKKVLRAARDTRFVFSYMPGGVITYAGNGQIASGPELGKPNSPFTIGASVMLRADGSMELKNYCIVGLAFEQPMVKALEAEDITRCNYLQWMGAEAVRLSYPTEDGALEKLAITREMIVRRVANTLDGSHPSAAATNEDMENSFDAAVHHLLQYQMGGLPLPYFILLKIAQDILSIAPKLLGIPQAESAT
jgi:hypothetical protein